VQTSGREQKKTKIMDDDELSSELVKLEHLNNPLDICDRAYIYYPAELQHTIPQLHGKWLVYVPKTELNHTWSKVKSLLPIEGVVLCKASTNRPHSHAFNVTTGVIMVYCANMHEDGILKIGHYLIAHLDYRSPFGRMYYKTEQQSREGSRATNRSFSSASIQSTFAIPVTRSVAEPIFSSAASPEADKIVEWASRLGAIWDTRLNQWCAPNDDVAQKMMNYLPRRAAAASATTTTTMHDDECLTLSCYSINTWASSMYRPERMQEIYDSIERHHPDVVMLQEMVPETLSILHPLLSKIGFQTRSQFGNTKRFGEMLYFNTMTLHALRFEQCALAPDATMKRELHMLVATHKSSNRMFVFATAHLEPSRERHALRLLQLHALAHRLSAERLPWVFGGDTNVAYYQEGELHLGHNIRDAWQAMGEDYRTRGTWDPSKNTNLCYVGRHVGCCRFDRILFDGNCMKIKQFQLTCTNPIESIGLHASDHFGIMAEFLI